MNYIIYQLDSFTYFIAAREECIFYYNSFRKFSQNYNIQHYNSYFYLLYNLIRKLLERYLINVKNIKFLKNIKILLVFKLIFGYSFEVYASRMFVCYWEIKAKDYTKLFTAITDLLTWQDLKCYTVLLMLF